MPGLENILGTIEENGRNKADAMIKSAEEKAEKIRADGESAAQTAYEEYIEKCKAQCSREYAAAGSAAEADAKRKLLACKIEAIDGIIERALEKIDDLPDGEYFAAVLSLAKGYVQTGNGVMYFGKRDLGRLPADFAGKLTRLAPDGKSSLTVSDEPADIENGFILSYGNISENCSFRAIAESEKDELRDKIAGVLFGQITR